MIHKIHSIKRKIFQCMGIVLSIFFSTYIYIHAGTTNSTLFLEILPGTLTISHTGNISRQTITTPLGGTTITGTISPNIFQIDDKVSSCSGYYTTIQAGPLIANSNTIPASAISFQTLSSPTLLEGNINPQVLFGNEIHNTRGTIFSPKTHFKRGKNQGCFLIGHYWDSSNLKISIPANQATGDYRGKIYYLLYDGRDI